MAFHLLILANLHNVGTSYLSVTLHNSIYDERGRPQRRRRARRHSDIDREEEAEEQEVAEEQEDNGITSR